jgi:hypothetical protein
LHTFGTFTNFLPDVSLPVARRGCFTAPPPENKNAWELG